MRLCVIPARGGSQRIPRKNIRPFCGKPMLVHPILAAQASGLFDHIVVSTDDAEIADVARQWGAEAPYLRPAPLADHHTGTAAVVRHAILWYREQGMAVEDACCLYATAALVRAEDLIAAYERLRESGKTYVFSVVRYPHPIERALQLGEDGSVTPVHPEHRTTRTQDLRPKYFDAGQFYWGTAQGWVDEVPVHSTASLGFVLPAWRVQDIDDEDDWRRAEALYRMLSGQG